GARRAARHGEVPHARADHATAKGAAPVDCTLIDAELVAFHLNALERAPRAAVEEHLAGCARCVRAWLDLKHAIDRDDAANEAEPRDDRSRDDRSRDDRSRDDRSRDDRSRDDRSRDDRSRDDRSRDDRSRDDDRPSEIARARLRSAVAREFGPRRKLLLVGGVAAAAWLAAALFHGGERAPRDTTPRPRAADTRSSPAVDTAAPSPGSLNVW